MSKHLEMGTIYTILQFEHNKFISDEKWRKSQRLEFWMQNKIHNFGRNLDKKGQFDCRKIVKYLEFWMKIKFTILDEIGMKNG